MTESEAKQMKCCGPKGCGRLITTESLHTSTTVKCCDTTKCMGWRWENQSAKSLEDNGRMGFCGLSGRP